MRTCHSISCCALTHVSRSPSAYTMVLPTFMYVPPTLNGISASVSLTSRPLVSSITRPVISTTSTIRMVVRNTIAFLETLRLFFFLSLYTLHPCRR